MNKIIEKSIEQNVLSRFKDIIELSDKVSGVSSTNCYHEPPLWFDEEKFKRGNQVFEKYFTRYA